VINFSENINIYVQSSVQTRDSVSDDKGRTPSVLENSVLRGYTWTNVARKWIFWEEIELL